MPDSPLDDPFADLFGKLPDPRTQAAGAARSNSTDDGGSAMTPGSDTPSVPSSRRAARAAAAATPTSPPPISAPIELPAHAGTAAPTPAAGTAHAADAARAASPQATALSTESDPDDWPFAGANGTAPALPYSRTGGNPIVTAPAADAAALGDDFEDLFSGAGSSDTVGLVPPRPNKRRRRIGGWIALAVVLMLFGGVAAGGLWVWNTYEAKIREFMGWEEPKDYAEGQASGEALVTISSGDNGSTISQSLYDAGVTKDPDAFYDMLVDTAQNPTFYPGVYRLQMQMTSPAALAALQDPANKLENSALVREGLTVQQTLPILAEGIGLPLEDFEAAIADPSVYGVTVDPAIVAAGGQPLEGWLFPAMYEFDPGATANDVIQTMVDRTVVSLESAGVPVEDRQRVLTVASIIQREARFEEDFYKVSRVIANRLDPGNQETFGLLQMDSTAQYGFGELHDGTVSSSEEALTDDNLWNTYVHTGLPIGPISNPGDTAIDAAMHPADGDWMYFVTVNLDTGETVFTSNVGDHERAVAQWRSWCADNPDSGC